MQINYIHIYFTPVTSSGFMQRPSAHRQCMDWVVSGVLVKLCRRGAAVTQGYALIYCKSVWKKQKARAGQKLLPKAIYRSLV